MQILASGECAERLTQYLWLLLPPSFRFASSPSILMRLPLSSAQASICTTICSMFVQRNLAFVLQDIHCMPDTCKSCRQADCIMQDATPSAMKDCTLRGSMRKPQTMMPTFGLSSMPTVLDHLPTWSAEAFETQYTLLIPHSMISSSCNHIHCQNTQQKVAAEEH